MCSAVHSIFCKFLQSVMLQFSDQTVIQLYCAPVEHSYDWCRDVCFLQALEELQMLLGSLGQGAGVHYPGKVFWKLVIITLSTVELLCTRGRDQCRNS